MPNSKKRRAAKWVGMKKAEKSGVSREVEREVSITMWVTYCHTEKRNIGDPTPDYNTAEANTEIHIQTTNPNHNAETIASN